MNRRRSFVAFTLTPSEARNLAAMLIAETSRDPGDGRPLMATFDGRDGTASVGRVDVLAPAEAAK